MQRGKSRGHLRFGLVPTAEPGLSSPLHPLCSQEGLFCPGSQGEGTAPGRAASRRLLQAAHLHAAGNGDGPCSAPRLMALCLAAQQRAPRAPKAPSDCEHPRHKALPAMTKIKAHFSSKSLTVRDSTGQPSEDIASNQTCLKHDAMLYLGQDPRYDFCQLCS